MRIKPEYFILALIVVISLCYILGNREINNQDQSGTNFSLINITPDKLQDSISMGISFVLFYQPNSDVCKNMEYKLNRLALEKGKIVRFYTVNIKDENDFADKYNISGTPNICYLRTDKNTSELWVLSPFRT
ncbi:MAG: thioredoxin domain-containing protein [Dysgonomonas sp.]